jgi:phage terminase large subunit-like protein
MVVWFGMTREQLLILASEIKRREDEKNKNKLLCYNTDPTMLHKKQIEFHKSAKRNRWNFGGNRTGKTVSGAVEAVWYARGNHPYKKIDKAKNGWVVSLTNEVQRDVAQKEILRWLNPDWIVSVAARRGRSDDLENCILDFITIKNIFGTTSRIGFKSCDQGRGKFQGTSLDYIWFDEEPPKEIYDECKMRVFDTSGDMWGTMTPLMGLTWVYDEIYKNELADSEIEYRFFQWEDNPYLSKDEIEYLIATMPEKEREARQYGRFINLSSAMFPEFNEEIHICKPFKIPTDWKRYYVNDYGFDMFAGLWVAVDYDKNVYIYNEKHIADLLISEASEQILDFEKIEEINNNYKFKYTRYCPPDFRKRSHQNGVTWYDTFFDNGINFIEASNKREYGWSCIREMMKVIEIVDPVTGQTYKTAKLKIFDNCEVLIEHLQKALRDPKNKDDILDKTDGDHYITHILDALRYFCISWYSAPARPKEEVSEAIKYKQKLLKKMKGNIYG